MTRTSPGWLSLLLGCLLLLTGCAIDPDHFDGLNPVPGTARKDVAYSEMRALDAIAAARALASTTDGRDVPAPDHPDDTPRITTTRIATPWTSPAATQQARTCDPATATDRPALLTAKVGECSAVPAPFGGLLFTVVPTTAAADCPDTATGGLLLTLGPPPDDPCT